MRPSELTCGRGALYYCTNHDHFLLTRTARPTQSAICNPAVSPQSCRPHLATGLCARPGNIRRADEVPRPIVCEVRSIALYSACLGLYARALAGALHAADICDERVRNCPPLHRHAAAALLALLLSSRQTWMLSPRLSLPCLPVCPSVCYVPACMCAYVTVSVQYMISEQDSYLCLMCTDQ